MPRTPMHSDAEIRRVAEQHVVRGVPLSRIAPQMGCSERTLSNALRRHGLPVASRGRVGEQNGCAKLTRAQVWEILTAALAGAGRDELAAQHGVRPATVEAIVKGRLWHHVWLSLPEMARYRPRRRPPTWYGIEDGTIYRFGSVDERDEWVDEVPSREAAYAKDPRVRRETGL